MMENQAPANNKPTHGKDPLLTLISQEEYPDFDSLPQMFAHPHWYEPHPIAKYASNQLRQILESFVKNPNHPWSTHNFGMRDDLTIKDDRPTAGNVGKMFGILVVRSPDSSLGYLKAYSGSLLGVTRPQEFGFCPPLYNRFDDHDNGDCACCTGDDNDKSLHNTGFSYQKEEAELNEMNRQIKAMEANPERTHRQQVLEEIKETTAKALSKARKDQKAQKKRRQQEREEMKSKLDEEEYTKFEEELMQKSAFIQRQVKALKAEGEAQVKQAQESFDELENALLHLKQRRKAKSANVQNQLFEQYQFLNPRGETKSLLPIFANTAIGRPPSGAGDCAAPKLFQYAFQHGYQPIAMAEFWWGKSPADEVRKHNFYYPACRGKCEPILAHMLSGMNVEENPLDHIGTGQESLEFLYEDDCMVVVNKPSEMLSVPGRHQEHSVYSVLQQKYPNATGPLLVHRLDMSTSGILVMAKNKGTHKLLQAQFVNRTVRKRYTALLEGRLSKKPLKGTIDLPLNSDYFNRPMQKVDYKDGKLAKTHYEVVDQEDASNNNNYRTRIHFYPVTGRTHQLRVHAAHASGLDIPIVGDDIYGQRDEQLGLCLHAGYLELDHPKSGKRMTFEAKTPF